MRDWYEREMKLLDEALVSGEIDDATYQAEMRNLNAELQQQAHDNAKQAYNDTMGF